MKKILAVVIICLFTVCVITCSSAAGNSLHDRIAKICEKIREMAPEEIPYEFGSLEEFTIVPDQKAVLLKCSNNPENVKEILIAAYSKHLYIYCVRSSGSFSGGGSPLERVERAFRAIGNCAVIAEWSEEKQGLRLKFILTDDRKMLTQKFKEFRKQGKYSNSGHWQNVVDLDELKLNVDERTEIFVRLWTEIKYNFANFDLVPEVNWDQVLEDKLPLVRQDQSNKEYAKLLVRCIAELRDGHTDVRMKFCEIFDQAQPALVAKPIDGKAIITKVGNGKDIVKVNLKVGDEEKSWRKKSTLMFLLLQIIDGMTKRSDIY